MACRARECTRTPAAGTVRQRSKTGKLAVVAPVCGTVPHRYHPGRWICHPTKIFWRQAAPRVGCGYPGDRPCTPPHGDSGNSQNLAVGAYCCSNIRRFDPHCPRYSGNLRRGYPLRLELCPIACRRSLGSCPGAQSGHAWYAKRQDRKGRRTFPNAGRSTGCPHHHPVGKNPGHSGTWTGSTSN